QGYQSPDEAERACQEGLVAANLAKDPMAQCMLNVRLADIAKLSGRFKSDNSTDCADLRYREALQALEGWDHPTADQSEWRAHWQARIHRKQGSLALFQGNPREALGALQLSAAHFEQHGPPYEQSQLYHSMGWAHSLRGDWDSALDYHQQGLVITKDINQGEET